MSIATLTARRRARVAAAARGGPEALEAPSAEGAKKTIGDALSAVAAHVPTEIIALYTLVIATVLTPQAPVLPIWVFAVFLVATAVFVWLVFAVGEVEAGRPIPKTWSALPKWEATSAMIAFTAWSLAMPGSAFGNWLSPNLAGIVLVAVSLLLPLLDTLVTKSKPPA
ncbi:MAG: hypothetical protein K8H88_04805 [Sandaracinaceae bacterium]|nr:hypothetical protein [Sandaracinaceae bacterium]